MRFLFLLVSVAIVVPSLGYGHETMASGPESKPEVRLCSALALVGPGDQVEVEITGVLKGDYIYDPNEPICPEDVQPTTFAYFATFRPEDMRSILNRDKRVLVTVHGVLEGPKRQAQEQSHLPVALRIANANSERYGFDRSFRTQLVIDRIDSFAEVPVDYPWAGKIVPAKNLEQMPKLIDSKLPGFPVAAQRLGIEGSVRLLVDVSAGRVRGVNLVSSDDPILTAAAIDFVKSWRFEDSFSGSPESTIDYVLEKRVTPGDENPRVELRLPVYARITGPAMRW